VRFLVVNGVVVLGTLAFCSCLSPLTSWAGTTLGSEYRAEMHVTHTSHQKRMHIARPIVDEARAESKIAGRKLHDDAPSTGSAPGNFKYLKPFSEEWKQRQEQEARRMRAATSICRC
jgi:hypothetical protein